MHLLTPKILRNNFVSEIKSIVIKNSFVTAKKLALTYLDFQRRILFTECILENFCKNIALIQHTT